MAMAWCARITQQSRKFLAQNHADILEIIVQDSHDLAGMHDGSHNKIVSEIIDIIKEIEYAHAYLPNTVAIRHLSNP